MTGNLAEPGPLAHVLVVDDSPTALRLLQTVFESERYDVATATNATDGFQRACARRPDLVVTDGVMPGIDGFGLVRLLRTNPDTSGIPVIMLTAEATLGPQRDTTGPQPDAFVRKSANLEPLLLEVRDALARGRRHA